MLKGALLIGALMVGGAAQAQVAERPPLVQNGPRPTPVAPETWLTAEDYPPSAIRANEQGIADILIGVDASGKVTDCRITESSGSAALDAASCNLMMKRARFEPAIEGGKPVASHFPRRMSWRLPAPPLIELSGSASPLTDYAVDLMVSKFGKVTSCEVVHSRPFPETANQECAVNYPAGKDLGVVYTFRAKPIAARVRYEYRTTVTPIDTP